jgi:hypothetical protein
MDLAVHASTVSLVVVLTTAIDQLTNG